MGSSMHTAEGAPTLDADEADDRAPDRFITELTAPALSTAPPLR